MRMLRQVHQSVRGHATSRLVERKGRMEGAEPGGSRPQEWLGGILTVVALPLVLLPGQSTSSVALNNPGQAQHRLLALDREWRADHHSQSLSQKDCGPRSLWSFLRLQGMNVTYSQVYALCQPGKDGTDLWQLKNAAEQLGWKSEAYLISLQDAYESNSLGLLYQNDERHFVALAATLSEGYLGIDPRPDGRLRLFVLDPEGIFAQGEVKFLELRKTP
jgi:hypothetical protein